MFISKISKVKWVCTWWVFVFFWLHIFHYGRTSGSQQKQSLFRIICSGVVLVRSVDFLMVFIHGSCSSWTYKTSMRSDSTREKRHESVSEDWYLETAADPLHQGLSSLNDVWRLSLYVCFLSRFLKCQVSREKAWTKDGINPYCIPHHVRQRCTLHTYT